MAIALSRDHKPDEIDEAARVIAAGGRIEPYQDEEGNSLGPARVWLKYQDMPGLAMTRSLGDTVAASVGVISEPEIVGFDVTTDDKFLIIGSDGIFEFVSNEDAVRIVVPYYVVRDAKGACEALAREARRRWTKVSPM
jgi:serine/threonine protein phosphatase PrpC